MHVGILQLLFELSNLSLLLCHNHKLRIDVLGRNVGDLGGLTGIVQCAEILLEVLI